MSHANNPWHLAQTETEAQVANFELNLWRAFYSFIRWQEECEKCANGTDLTANELAILHVIRMNNKPKSINDISKILNREDYYNINYSIKKLTKLKLIEQVKFQNNKILFYQITKEGLRNTDKYTKLRKETLIEIFSKRDDLDILKIVEYFSKIVAIYNDADREVAIAAPLSENIKNIDKAPKTIKKTKK